MPVALASAASSGTWRRLPAAPIKADQLRTAVWTGKQMLVFGRHSITAKDARGNPYIVKTVDVAAAYDPSRNAWQTLSPPAGVGYSPGYAAAWTGRQMLVWGPFDALSYDPATNIWRTLPRPPTNAGRLAVWTGKELVGWGGGCCGDAFKDGAAFNPVTNTWRKLAPSPLAGSQGPLGAWTGRELVIFVGNLDPDGKPWPAASRAPPRTTRRRTHGAASRRSPMRAAAPTSSGTAVRCWSRAAARAAASCSRALPSPTNRRRIAGAGVRRSRPAASAPRQSGRDRGCSSGAARPAARARASRPAPASPTTRRRTGGRCCRRRRSRAVESGRSLDRNAHYMMVGRRAARPRHLPAAGTKSSRTPTGAVLRCKTGRRSKRAQAG